MRAGVIIVALCWQAISVWSQPFKCEAKLSPVDENGFYRVLISPEASVHLNTSFENIRIFDDQNSEIPYMLQEEKVTSRSKEFREYTILEKHQRPGCCTSLILHNPDRNAVTSINLVIKNADITKEAVLLGSDDQENWYALKQRFVLFPTANSSGTSDIKIVDFPLSNYRYFSLQINDSTSAPLNILRAGYFETVTSTGQYTEVPLKKITKTDSVKQKNTYVHVQFDTLRIVDFLELSMKGTAYFQRKALLYARKTRTLRTGEQEAYYDLPQEVELSSRIPAGIELSGMKAKDLLLVIQNEDNPPLEVDYVKAYLRNRYLVSFLTKGQSYSIKIGDESLHAPVYDLPYFKDSIPASPPTLEIGELTIFEKSEAGSGSTFFTTKAFVWAAVVLVIVILGFMSVRLLRDVGAEGNK